MAVRGVCIMVAALLALQGCTSTVYYAVVAPHRAMAAESGCVRKCQMMHAGQTNRYLACIQLCPEAEVVHEKQCSEVPFDRVRFACDTVQNQTFDPVVGLLVILTVVLFVVIGVNVA
jgi:hypothetical protein